MHSKQENAIYNKIIQSIKTDVEIMQLREIKDKGIKNIKQFKTYSRPKVIKLMEVLVILSQAKISYM